MNFEFGLGHRDGSVSGPFPTEEEMQKNLPKFYGSPVGRSIIGGIIGPWYDLDPVNGLTYKNPLYKN